MLLIAGQVIAFFLLKARPDLLSKFALAGSQVLQGHFAPLALFLFLPLSGNFFFAFIAWYLFYMMGTALESHWGTFRFNLYFLIGYLATVAVTFIYQNFFATTSYLYGSIFLAFAWLYPDFQLMIFFILPVKVKYLAMITWASYAWQFVSTHSNLLRLVILAAVLNFFLFFGRDIYIRLKNGQRRKAFQRRANANADKPFHICTKCGITEKTNPEMEFRFCSQCEGSHEYCMDHLHNHEHIKEGTPKAD